MFTFEDFAAKVRSGEVAWCLKVLSANDVGQTNTHQAGVYLPKQFIERSFAGIFSKTELNPRAALPYKVVGSTTDFAPLQIIYYNNRVSTANGTRNEFRITCWKNGDVAAYSKKDLGSELAIAISKAQPKEAYICIARTVAEAERLEKLFGVDPLAPQDIIVSPEDDWQRSYPEEWNHEFPSTEAISAFVFSKLCPWDEASDVDSLLIKRRDKEFQLLSILEKENYKALLKSGLNSVEAIVKAGKEITNRRKVRSGKSLENSLADIFLHEHVQFSAQVYTEGKRKPDFIFPSIGKYRDMTFPASKLYMLGAKTTLKDRWPQVVIEADRILHKHLFTLDTLVTLTEYHDITTHNLTLVIPKPYIAELPKGIQNEILSLSQFIEIQKENQAS